MGGLKRHDSSGGRTSRKTRNLLSCMVVVAYYWSLLQDGMSVAQNFEYQSVREMAQIAAAALSKEEK